MPADASMKLTQAQALATIIPGKVLHLLAPFPHKVRPENKLFVIAGEHKRPLMLKINSSPSRGLSRCEFRIRPKDYPGFLNRISYLDCDTVWYMLTKQEIVDQLVADPSRIRGDILPDHRNEIARLTASARGISAINKRIVVQNFGS